MSDCRLNTPPISQVSGGEAVILFTRVPIPGMTKTRLQKLLTPEECAKLHSCMLMDLKKLFEQCGTDYYVFFSPKGEEESMIRIFGDEALLYTQIGEDIGERMLHALSFVLAMGYEAVVLIGADIPELQGEDLITAFEVLQEHDVVLGPTEDGGYYLIGMKKPQVEVFECKTYGFGDVLGNTIRAIVKAGLTYDLIRIRQDIDEPVDILSFHLKVVKGLVNNKLYSADFTKYLVEKYWCIPV